MLLDEIKLPVQKRSKARLELVLTQTIAILTEQGVAACTIPAIALRANLPKINIYQYFPTVHHVFSVLVQRYLTQLQMQFDLYQHPVALDAALPMTHQLIQRVAQFYNQNPAASVLILGGPVHVDGFNLQEMVIEQIAQHLALIFAQQQPAVVFQRPEQIGYLVEIVFALMKHSFYKYACIKEDVLIECFALSDLYIASKMQSLE